MKGLKLFHNGQRLFLTTKERHRLQMTIRLFDTKQRIFCRLLYYTGCKLHEAIKVYPNQITAKKGCVLLGTDGIKLAERFVPIPPVFYSEILIYFQSQLQADYRALWDISRASGWRWLKEAMNKSGIHVKHATPTGLRHSFAISCLEVYPRIPLNYIKNWMGHRDVFLTASYLTTFQQEEADCLKYLWDHF